MILAANRKRQLLRDQTDVMGPEACPLRNGSPFEPPCRKRHFTGDTRFQNSSNSRVSKKAIALTTFASFMRKYHV